MVIFRQVAHTAGTPFLMAWMRKKLNTMSSIYDARSSDHQKDAVNVMYFGLVIGTAQIFLVFFQGGFGFGV